MPKILIVDDEPSLRFLIASALEDEGYELLEAADGVEAWELIKEQKPDLIILDVMMPGLTGLEVCGRIKQEPTLRESIVLMLTAKSQEEDRILCQRAGADYYLRKPFSPLDLLKLVNGLFPGEKGSLSLNGIG